MKQIFISKIVIKVSVFLAFVLGQMINCETTLAQKIIDINPGLDSQNVSPNTSISGVFDVNEDNEIKKDSVNIFVNNVNVTPQSTITDKFFSYRPSKPLAPGNNIVKIEYENINGDKKVVTWSFAVKQPQVNLNIVSITHNAVSQPLGIGANFIVTIKATPGAKCSVLLGENGKNIRSLPAQEVSPGVYLANLKVTNSDRFDEGIVIVRLEKQNQSIFAAATQSFAFDGDTPLQQGPLLIPPVNNSTNNTPLSPVFLSHRDGEKVITEGFTLVGLTQPNAVIEIKVTSKLPVLGGVTNLDLGRNTLVAQRILADSEGRFQVQVPAPATITSGVEYIIRAIAKNNNQVSEPIQITLIQK